MSRYKVSFMIEGKHIDDDINLTKENIKLYIKDILTPKSGYHNSRSTDTKISNLDIKIIRKQFNGKSYGYKND